MNSLQEYDLRNMVLELKIAESCDSYDEINEKSCQEVKEHFEKRKKQGISFKNAQKTVCDEISFEIIYFLKGIL